MRALEEGRRLEVRALGGRGKAGGLVFTMEESGTRRDRGRTMEVAVTAGDRGEMGVLGKGQKDFTWEKRV